MKTTTLLKNIPTKLVGGLIAVCIILIIVVCTLFYSRYIHTTVAVTLLIILFISNSLFTNELTSRVMYKKYNAKLNNPKTYQLEDVSIIGTILLNNKAIETKHKYGKSYLLIKDDKAYKVVLVDNSDLYFNNTQKNDTKPNSKLDKCSTFYGFEIFLNINEEVISKVQMFTFQTEKVYYTGFYSNESNTLIQANYEKPKDIHQEGFNYLINLIGANHENN